jgi:hypothetical protein
VSKKSRRGEGNESEGEELKKEMEGRYWGAPFVSSSSGGADGLSGSGGGSFSWGDHIGSGSCRAFGKSS